MNTKAITMCLAAAFMTFAGKANATFIDADFSWTGTGGYSMQGTITYDESFSTIEADYGSWVTNSAQNMTVSFYNPSSELLGTFVQVENGNIQYSYLSFGYDAADPAFDLGAYGFDVGGDEGNSDDYCLNGFKGSFKLFNGNSETVDSGGNLTVVPEPATMALLGIGGLMIRRRRRA